MKATDAYNQLNAVIITAVERKSYLYVAEAADELGMTGGEQHSPTILALYDYKGTFQDG